MAQGGDPKGNGTGGSGQNIVVNLMMLSMKELSFQWQRTRLIQLIVNFLFATIPSI